MPCTLTDAQLAAIAWAEPSETTSALAQRITASFHTVSGARRRMRRAGGWWCPLAIGVCSECARPLLFHAAVVPRQVHVACDAARTSRHRRRYRAGDRPHAFATLYSRAWRQRNPERYAQLEKAKHARDRGRWPLLPSDVRAAKLARRREFQTRDQAVTYSRADRRYGRWTADEDALVLADSDEADRELALELGRTLYAVQTRRCILRKRASFRT